MNKPQDHIIKSCHWLTDFDSKSDAMLLQSQISQWSLNHMSHEIYRFLDEVCEANKLLKIKNLEVDLGVLEFENFEEELTLRFREAFEEAFRKAIDAYDNTNIEFLDVKKSHLEIIRNFLRYGIRVSQKHSIHSLFTNLIHEHRMRLIQMIQSIAHHERVRKRIAWQLEESHIKEIIKGVEPSHHEEIFEFQEELHGLQTKESIVKGSANDFKKNVWYWILNYLFVDRGTIFNKKQFIQSTLVQMANHFNLEIQQLFDLIEQALENVYTHAKEKVEFFQIMKSILNERESESFNEKASEKQYNKYWKSLEKMLYNASERTTTDQKDYLNELIFQLWSRDEKRFVKLLSNKAWDLKSWMNLMKDINDLSFQSLLIGFEPEKGEEVLYHFEQIKQSGVFDGLSISESKLRAFTLLFSRENKSKIVTKNTYIQFVLREVSKQENITEEELLDIIMDSSKSKNAEEISSLKVYQELGRLYKQKTLESIPKKITSLRLRSILREEESQRKELVLSTWIQTQPTKLWEILLKDSVLLKEFTQKVASRNLLELLIKIDRNKAALISRLISRIEKSERGFSDKLKEEFKGSLLKHTLNFIGIQEGISMSVLLRKVLISIEFTDQLWMLEGFNDIKNITSTILDQRNKDDDSEKSEFEQIQEGLQHRIFEKSSLAKTIFQLVHDRKISVKELIAQGNELQSYFIQGKLSKDDILKPYIDKIIESTELTTLKVVDIMNELFWKVLLSYDKHQGSAKIFTQLLRNTIEERFEKSLPKKAQKKKKKEVIEEQPVSVAKGSREEVVDFLLQIDRGAISKEAFAVMQESMSVKEFFSLAASNRMSAHYSIFTSFHQLIILLEDAGYDLTSKRIADFLWGMTFEVLQKKINQKVVLEKLVTQIFEILSEERTIEFVHLVNQLEKRKVSVYRDLWIALVTYQTSFQRLLISEETEVEIDLLTVEKRNKTVDLIESLIFKGEIPFWFEHTKAYTTNRLLNELLESNPLLVVSTLKKKEATEGTIVEITKRLEGEKFLTLLSNTESSYYHLLDAVKVLYRLLGTLKINHISGYRLQESLLKMVLRAWINGSFEMINKTKIWKSLFWELWRDYRIEKNEILKEIKPLERVLPNSLKISLKNMHLQEERTSTDKKPIIKKMTNDDENIMKEGIPVSNAGLVILNTYFGMLFERLNLAKNGQFVSFETQLNAVHYLQYIVTGLEETEEDQLILNKILCGLDIEEPVQSGIKIPDNEKQLIDGMIQSSIAYWSAIGESTVYGFRGNWLVREGILREEQDRWELTVEKRSYDILMQRSPFSFSIIKLPWMKKPLHVTWPY